jgi:hypothetical protein
MPLRELVPDDNRHHLGRLYGGLLDVVGETKLSPATFRDLKFAALFLDHIIVPDGFSTLTVPYIGTSMNWRRQTNCKTGTMTWYYSSLAMA